MLDCKRTGFWRRPLKQAGAEGARRLSEPPNLSGKRTEKAYFVLSEGAFFGCTLMGMGIAAFGGLLHVRGCPTLGRYFYR